MPMYEYVCEKCNKVHEILQKFSDEPLKTCPDCGASVEKLMSLSAFSLKGSGWYTTDYKRSSAPSTPATPSAEKSGGGEACAPGGCGQTACAAPSDS